MAFRNLTIKTKILSALALTFTILLISTAVYLGSNQRHLVTELAEEKVDDIANTYFDGVNTMMLTGTTSQRHILKQKLVEEPGIVDVTILRAPSIIEVFGNGIDGELPVTEEDRRAINGERLKIMEETENGRQLTTWIPLKASSDYRGTNCLTCHPVPENTVLGATKAVYSLAAIDEKVSKSIMAATLINIAMFVAGILAMMLLLISV